MEPAAVAGIAALADRLPKCGKEMRLVERSSDVGDDCEPTGCDDCAEEPHHELRTALWKVLSDARQKATSDLPGGARA